MKRILISIISALLLLPASAVAAGPVPSAERPEERSILSLEEALALALSKNPLLIAYGWQVRAAESEAGQAAAFNNPGLEFEVENAGGTGAMEGMEAAEKTLLLTQEIRTAGKRSKKRKVAAIEAELAGLELDVLRRETAALTEMAFIELLAAQSGEALAEEMTELSAGILDIARERVAAGKVAPLEERKAAVSHSSSVVDLESARRRVDIARRRLASMWGEDEPSFARASGDMGGVSPLPPLDTLVSLASISPGMAAAGMEVERRRASLSLEKAMRFPDLTISAGARWFEESGDRAFVFGLSVPIPLLDRGGAAARRAEYMMNKAVEEKRAAEISVRTRLAEMHAEASAARREAEVIFEEVLPSAQAAFDTAREGYIEGKWGLIEVLDAQRMLVDVKKREIEALAAYGSAICRLGEITGRGILGTGAGDYRGLEKNRGNTYGTD